MPNTASDSAYQTTQHNNSRRSQIKTVLAAMIVFGLVLGVYNGILQLLFSLGADLNGRMLGEMRYLPELARPTAEKKVMVFGSSMVQAGFEPNTFDQAMLEREVKVTSFNYGIGNLNPAYQELMTRRIKEAMQSTQQKFALSLVEFTPFQATKTRASFGKFTADQNVALLSSFLELADLTLQDPTRGLRLLNIRYLRSGISAELITTIPQLIPELDEPDSLEFIQARQRANKARSDYNLLLEENHGKQSSAQWQILLRGGRMDKSAHSAELHEKMQAYVSAYQHPLIMQSDLDRRVRTADILEMNFHPPLVDAFINMVLNLKAVSALTEVILLPRNTDWVVYSLDSEKRLRETLEYIRTSTGVPIRDFQTHKNINPSHFIDSTHLSTDRGIDVFSKLLATTYEDLLKATPDDVDQ